MKRQAMARTHRLGVAIGAFVAVCVATPALAEVKPSTRLVSCGGESCLLVTGHRDSADAEVRVNGHAVAVQGKRNWRVRLPVSTVRDWSAPFARKIEVSTYNLAAPTVASQFARLPIGLLGHVPDLASLVITMH
jgi:hypothetical protein